MYVSRDKRRIDFRGLTGTQRTPQIWDVTNKMSTEDLVMTFEFIFTLSEAFCPKGCHFKITFVRWHFYNFFLFFLFVHVNLISL